MATLVLAVFLAPVLARALDLLLRGYVWVLVQGERAQAELRQKLERAW